MDSELAMLNSIHGDFYRNGISSMDTSVGIIHGRPYGGLAVLYRRSIASSCNFINYEDDRIQGMELLSNNGKLLILNVYFPYECQNIL